MNTNMIHNILNIAIAFIAAAIAFDWTVIVSVPVAATIAGVLATIKVIVNIVRDGLGGLMKEQPPVGSTVVPPGVVVVDVPKAG